MRAVSPALLHSASASHRTMTSSPPSSPSSPRNYNYPVSPTSTLASYAPTTTQAPDHIGKVNRKQSVCSNNTGSAVTMTTITEPSAWQLQLTESILSRVSTSDFERQGNGIS